MLMPSQAFGDSGVVRGGCGGAGAARAPATKLATREAVVTVLLAVLIALVGPPILPHLLGVKASIHNPRPINWTRAATPLRILMATAVPSAALAVLTPVALLAQPDRVFDYALGALAGNIALNLLLVPSWGLGLGATGAALAFLVTEPALVGVLWATLPAPAAAPAPAPV